MDLAEMCVGFLKASPKYKSKIENITGQPIDHVSKCFNSFMDNLKSGPGIESRADKERSLNANYELVLGLGGFKDHEARILAADMTGYSLGEITQFFRMQYKWNTNIDEIEKLYEDLYPRFKQKAVKAGLIKEDSDKIDDNSSIPSFGGKVNTSSGAELSDPPWKQESKPISPTS